MIKAILFDLDGTLIDSESYYVNGTIEWLSKCGISISFKDACGIIGKTMDDTYTYIAELTKLNKLEIIEKNEEYFNKKNPLDFNQLLFNDVIECLAKQKRRGLKLCICSMSSKEYIKRFIEDCHLNVYIDKYYSGEDCTKDKPDPEIYNKAIKDLGLCNNEVLIVEDAPSGIKAGLKSNAYVVARNDAKFGLIQDDALYVLEDLSELSTIIMEINNGKYD